MLPLKMYYDYMEDIRNINEYSPPTPEDQPEPKGKLMALLSEDGNQMFLRTSKNKHTMIDRGKGDASCGPESLEQLAYFDLSLVPVYEGEIVSIQF